MKYRCFMTSFALGFLEAGPRCVSRLWQLSCSFEALAHDRSDGSGCTGERTFPWKCCWETAASQTCATCREGVDCRRRNRDEPFAKVGT